LLLYSQENGYRKMFVKQKCIGWLVGVLFCNVLKAQLPVPVHAPCGAPATITGVVNTYYPGLNDLNTGGRTINLGPATGNATPLVAGDRVLIIQMQDATINTSNTPAYGGNGTGGNGLIDPGNSGLFEFGQVRSFAGGVLTLRDPLQHSYRAVSGIPNRKSAYQVVRVPAYQNVTLGGTVAAAAWDGTSGGIVAFHAWQILNMNGYEITATGLGFRPGKINSAGGLYNIQDYVSNTYGSYGEKGEGIAGTPNGTWAATAGGYENGSFGRGAPANAGGGGNAHNSGGGGGANFGDGGKGGYQYSGPQDVGGRGGKGFKTGLPAHIIMGGGGGGGHQNNNAAEGGEHGGGIIMITASAILGTGIISADGLSAGPSTDDGAGGGGAGGSIVLSYNGTLAAGITLTAKGGAGGNETFLARHGSGGGGGGGVVITSTPAAANVSGGLRGLSNGTEWGTVDGEPGTTQDLDLSTLQPISTLIPLLQVKDTTFCAPATIDITGANVITDRDQGPEFLLSFWTDILTTIPVPTPQAISQSGTYYIKLTNTNTKCEVVAPVQITVHSQPSLTLAATPPSCMGSGNGSIIPTSGNGTGPYEYSSDGGLSWNSAIPNNLPAGAYSIITRDSYGCISQPASVTLTDPPLLVLSEVTSAHTDISCYGNRNGQLQLNAVGGSNGYVYTIKSPVTGAISNNSGMFTGLPAGIYSSTVRDSHDCISQPVSITLTEPPLLMLSEVTSAHADVSCHGNRSGQLRLNAAGGANGYVYTITSQTTGNITNNSGLFTGLPAGIYAVRVTDAAQCSQSTELIILEPPQLNAALLSKTDIECGTPLKGHITLTANGGVQPYLFGIGNNSWQPDSVFTGLEAGSYMLTVRDGNNCLSAPLLTQIFVDEACDIIFPTAFTPNGDGRNDLFRPKNYGHISNYQLSIYNRWGVTIFQSNDPAAGWDGHFKGVLADTGTFVWMATFMNKGGEKKTLKGTVTLVK